MADDLTLGELARTVEREQARTRADLSAAVETIKGEIKGLVRIDVHSAEHSVLLARLAADEQARSDLAEEVRRERTAAAAERREREERDEERRREAVRLRWTAAAAMGAAVVGPVVAWVVQR